MFKMSKFLAILTVIAMGGFIGFINTNNQNLNASTTMIRWVDVPKPVDTNIPDFFGININLQNDSVLLSSNIKNATVSIQKEIKEVPVYVEKEVEKVVYEPDLIWSTKLLKTIAPLHLPKINVDRN